MKLNELKSLLAEHPAARVRFQLPKGDLFPAHAHVTEVKSSHAIPVVFPDVVLDVIKQAARAVAE